MLVIAIINNCFFWFLCYDELLWILYLLLNNNFLCGFLLSICAYCFVVILFFSTLDLNKKSQKVHF